VGRKQQILTHILNIALHMLQVKVISLCCDQYSFVLKNWGRRGRDRIVVGF
jgi:hypothetical protein